MSSGIDASPTPPDLGMPPFAGRGRRVSWLVVLVVAVIVIAVTGALRHTVNPRVPDLRAMVGSAQIKGLDQESSAALDAQLPQIGQGAPWLTGEGQGISDSCQVSSQGSGILSRASWSAQCQRVETAYYAFDGNLTSRLSELQRLLVSQGWSSAPLSAGASPVTVSPGAGGKLAAFPGKVGMEVGWVAQGQSLASLISLMAAGSPSSVNTEFFRTIQVKYVDQHSLATQSFRAHRYFLAIKITVQYYTDPDVQASPLPSS